MEEPDSEEPPKESAMILLQESDFKRKTSAGSLACTRKILRELSTHKEQLRKGFKKAFAGSWRDDPATVQRINELKKQAERNSLLRRQVEI